MIVRVKEFKGYGLLYYLDDEDEVYSDEFRVLVSKKGKCGWKRDENFSPCRDYEEKSVNNNLL